MDRWSRLVVVLAAVLAAGLFVARTDAAGERYIVYGADTTFEERFELGTVFGAGDAVPWQTIETPEMVQALEGTGLPAALSDQSVSSSVLTCLNRGDGLTVRTRNITRITAPVYANALVTAGVGDATVLIAAPAGRAVTGESALVGVLKAFPQCQAGRGPDPARVALAYEQIARTVALAGGRVDLNTASTALLDAAQPVVLGQARDDGAIGAALESAMQRAGVPLDPVNRAELTGFLKKLATLDYGAYAKGYRVQVVSPEEVRVTPAGAGAPIASTMPAQAAAAQSAAPGGAGREAAAAPAGTAQGQAAPGTVLGPEQVLSGEVRRLGGTLTINREGAERHVQIGQGVSVFRDGERATLGDVRRGDRVLVVTGPDGFAERIEAVSGTRGSTNPAAWLVPLLLGLGLLAALWWLLSRRKEPFILQRTSGPTARQTDGRG